MPSTYAAISTCTRLAIKAAQSYSRSYQLAPIHLSENRLDGFAGGEVWTVDPSVICGVVQGNTERMQNSCVDVLRMHGITLGVSCNFVGFTI